MTVVALFSCCSNHFKSWSFSSELSLTSISNTLTRFFKTKWIKTNIVFSLYHIVEFTWRFLHDLKLSRTKCGFALRRKFSEKVMWPKAGLSDHQISLSMFEKNCRIESDLQRMFYNTMSEQFARTTPLLQRRTAKKMNESCGDIFVSEKLILREPTKIERCALVEWLQY